MAKSRATFCCSGTRNLNFNDCDVIVLNDEYQNNLFTGKPRLINRLEEILPGKSKFENEDVRCESLDFSIFLLQYGEFAL